MTRRKGVSKDTIEQVSEARERLQIQLDKVVELAENRATRGAAIFVIRDYKRIADTCEAELTHIVESRVLEDTSVNEDTLLLKEVENELIEVRRRLDSQQLTSKKFEPMSYSGELAELLSKAFLDILKILEKPTSWRED